MILLFVQKAENNIKTGINNVVNVKKTNVALNSLAKMCAGLYN